MTNPGKTSHSSSPSSYCTCSSFLACPTHSKKNRVASLCPPSRNCLVEYAGTVWRWEGGFEKVLDHMFIRIWPGRLRVYVHETVGAHFALYCWVTWWRGSSGTSLDFLSPPNGPLLALLSGCVFQRMEIWQVCGNYLSWKIISRSICIDVVDDFFFYLRLAKMF